jgi:hypothetical protein
MNKLYTAIYNKYTTNTALAAYTTVGGRFYLNHAPQEATFPYIVYFCVTDVADSDFGEDREDYMVQFNIFSQNNSASEAGTILTAVKSLFDDCSITVASWRHLYMQRRMTFPNNDPTQEPPIHGYSVEYDILIEKTQT